MNNYNNNNNNENIYKENLEILKKIKNKIKDSDKILNVVINEKSGTIIYLIGSIHVSEKSSNDIKEMLNIIQPNTIFLELSDERVQLLTATENQILNELLKKPSINWFTTSLSEFYLSIHKQFYYYLTKLSISNNNNNNDHDHKDSEDSSSGKHQLIYGNEFRIGYKYAKDNGCSIILGDRDYKTTWNRLFSFLDFKCILNESFTTFKKFLSIYNKSPQELKSLYNKSVDELINASWNDDHIFRKDMSEPLQKVLIDERDQFMASVIRDSTNKMVNNNTNNNKMVAIIGKGHVKGISNHINDHNKEGFYLRMELENFKEPSLFSKYSYPILLPSLIIVPPTIGVYSFHKFIKPLSKKQFSISLLSLVSIELISTNLIISNFLNKFEKL